MNKLLPILLLLTFNAYALDPTIEPLTRYECNWPIERTDGKIFTEAERGGINLYRSNISGIYDPDKLVEISNTICAFTIDNTLLTNGTYYFVTTAFDTEGRSSNLSVETSHTIEWPPLPPKPATALVRVPLN